MASISGRSAHLCLSVAFALTPAAPAFAAKAPPAPEVTVSEAFLGQARQVQAGVANGTASGAMPGLRSSAQSSQEKYIAGQLALEYAAMRNDMGSARNAVADILQSGQASQNELPKLWYLAGYYSYMQGDYAYAKTALNNARQQGYSEPDLALIQGDIQARQRKPADALPLVQEGLNRKAQAGKPLTADNYDRLISIAYQSGKWDDVSRFYQKRLALESSPAEWRSALVNAQAAPGLNGHAALDLYRLQAATGALASERDYQSYAQAADARGYDAEVKAVVESGQSSGDLQAANPITSKLLKTANPKAAKAVASLPVQARKAATASNGSTALDAAEGYFAIGQYSQAVPLFRIALSKGGVDVDRANTRLGVALARSGDLAGGRAALVQVQNGDWGRVAGFWTVWIDQQMSKLGAAPPVTPTLAG